MTGDPDAALAEIFAALSGLEPADTPTPDDWRTEIVRQATQAIGVSQANSNFDGDSQEVARSQLAFARRVFALALEALEAAEQEQEQSRSDVRAFEDKLARFQKQLDVLETEG
jgi:hypothetical protein